MPSPCYPVRLPPALEAAVQEPIRTAGTSWATRRGVRRVQERRYGGICNRRWALRDVGSTAFSSAPRETGGAR